MKASVFSANDWVYPESQSEISEIKLNSAKGSYIGAQLILDGLDGNVSWTVEYDRYFEGGMELFELLPVNVNRNSDFFEPLDIKPRTNEEMERLYTKKAPFSVYDPMKPIKNNSFSAKARIPLYVNFKVPSTVSRGVYSGKITFNAQNGSISVPFSIKVYNINVPNKRTLQVTNWVEPRLSAYNCGQTDGEILDLYLKIAEYGLKARQNCFFISSALFRCKNSENGIVFDFSLVERLITALLDMGYTRIEVCHIEALYNSRIKPFFNETVYSQNGLRLVEEFLKAWYAVICKNNWNSLIIQHAADEPKDGGAENYLNLVRLIRKIMPEIKIVDAILTTEICEAVDIPVPITRHYQLHKAEYDEILKTKQEKWFYTCCWPTAPYLNRFLDMPLISTRLIHWLNLILDFDGYLHWGFCCQGAEQDVFKEPSIAFKYMGVPESDQFLPAGDTNIIYPTADGPIGSVRLEMMRAGIEDYELLKLLRQKNKPEIDKIMSLVIDENWCARVDFAAFEKIHNGLLELGERL